MDNKKILILHLSRLGDMIQSLPAIKLLKEEFPQCSITYLGIEEFCQTLTDVPWIDNLVMIPWQDISIIMGEFNQARVEALDHLIAEIHELNQEYDVLINLTHNWGSTYLSKKVSAKVKKGRIFSEKNEIVLPGKWEKYLFAMAKNQKENLFNLVDIYTGMTGAEHRSVKQYLTTGPEVDAGCTAKFSDLGFEKGKLAVGFQLGTSKIEKKWPLNNFVKLGEILFSELNAQIILFGSEKEKELASRFKKLASYPFIDLIGNTRLEELPAFFKKIDVLVSNDTGPMHIAAAVDTKVVGIYTGTAYFGITGPYGRGHVVLQTNYTCAPCLASSACASPRCRDSIKPETVVQGVRIALGMETKTPNFDNGASLYQSVFSEQKTLKYQLIRQDTEGFLPWLKSSQYFKALVGQKLWNNWLGLGSSPNDADLVQKNGQKEKLLMEFQKTCSAYDEIYQDGKRLCQKIIDEFQRENQNYQLIQMMAASLSQVEERIKHVAGHLPILNEIHGYYMAETEECSFPMLAYQFLDKYKTLESITASFQAALQIMSR